MPRTIPAAGHSIWRRLLPLSNEPPSLIEKLFGYITGCRIGSAKGAPVEGWLWERMGREHGSLGRLLPSSHYGQRD